MNCGMCHHHWGSNIASATLFTVAWCYTGTESVLRIRISYGHDRPVQPNLRCFVYFRKQWEFWFLITIILNSHGYHSKHRNSMKYSYLVLIEYVDIIEIPFTKKTLGHRNCVLTRADSLMLTYIQCYCE